MLPRETLEEARAMMQAEALIERGMRQVDLRPRELREGRMTINLNASTSTFNLDSAFCPCFLARWL